MREPVKSGSVPESTLIGKRIAKLDAPDKASGKTRYIHDLEVPGELHARILRSTQVHARIVSIDTRAAKALPGVHAVITAADVTESKLRLAEKMGAHQVIDARRDPVKQVMDITANRGADVVIDLVGNDLTLANGMKMLRKGGSLIIVGYGGTLNVKAIDVIFSEFSVLGSLVGNWDELRELMELTRQGKVRVITQKGKLDEVNDILEQLKKGTLEGRGVVIP